MSVSGILEWDVTMRTVNSSPRFSRTMTGRFLAPDLSSKYSLAFQTSIAFGSAFPRTSFLSLMVSV